MKVLYLDESGNHALDSIDHDYPIFVLGGIIVDRAYAYDVLEPRVAQLKRDYFGRDDIILHTADISRAKNGFEALSDPSFRMTFLAALNGLMAELEYQVVACAIKKTEHLKHYGAAALDPYMYSLDIVIERFCHEIGATSETGIIFAEKRSPVLDYNLDEAWEQIKRVGTRYVGRDVINHRIIDLSLKDKRLNIAGLQLADMVISPIGRKLIGKPPRQDWEIVETKFRRYLGDYRGAGLIVRP